MYSFIKNILFCLDPETSHDLSLKGLQVAHQFGLTPSIKNNVAERKVMGLSFPNPIGLAAGLDKNADYVDALATLGFGFIEIGTVTPKPQTGNPRPRLFRLKEQEAIINRFGFNSKGVEYVAKKLEKINYRGILGINIGKNRDTPLDKAIDDYLFGFKYLWKFASYITINISSPNTQGLRDLQKSDALSALLGALKHEQQKIALHEKKYIPLVVKISPDLSQDELTDIAQVLLTQKIDGVIATNTTIQREGVEHSSYAKETGGLSGKPLQAKSTEIIRKLYALVQEKIPIIGVGGIMDEKNAREKFATGASLLQVYTGLIYQGPRLVKRLISL